MAVLKPLKAVADFAVKHTEKLGAAAAESATKHKIPGAQNLAAHPRATGLGVLAGIKGAEVAVVTPAARYAWKKTKQGEKKVQTTVIGKGLSGHDAFGIDR